MQLHFMVKIKIYAIILSMEISLLFLTIMNVFGVCTIVNTENKFDLKGLTLSDILSRHFIQNEEVYISKAYVTEKDVSEIEPDRKG